MANLAAVDALCALEHPYRVDAHGDHLFDAAMRELLDYHCLHSPGYADWLASRQFDAAMVHRADDWWRLPPIFANYFKQRLLLSDTGAEALELSSSGTSGQRSRMRYDLQSLNAAQSMVDRIFHHYRWQSATPCNYLLLSHEPGGASDLGCAYTDHFLCKYAPVQGKAYALRYSGNGHEFDCHGVIRALQDFARQGLPVRIFGFPALLWFVLERMRAVGHTDLRLAPESLVFFGGGWKTHADSEVGKTTLYRRIGEQLGIADLRCRDGYGAVEHCIPYIECPRHHFHVPVYARAYVRDCATLARLAPGEAGFLHLVSPYIRSSPAHSVLMSDLARLYPGAACGCGLQTDWFELLGRASRVQGRSCALAASELLPES
jgi:phenylacetate-coenzyme A ligase PaaK-like adenylate-forming protein